MTSSRPWIAQVHGRLGSAEQPRSMGRRRMFQDSVRATEDADREQRIAIRNTPSSVRSRDSRGECQNPGGKCAVDVKTGWDGMASERPQSIRFSRARSCAPEYVISSSCSLLFLFSSSPLFLFPLSSFLFSLSLSVHQNVF